MCSTGVLWPLGVAVHLAFWVLLIGGIVWLIRRGGWRPRDSRRRSLDVLGERYARGEIDRDEYDERRSVLDSRA